METKKERRSGCLWVVIFLQGSLLLALAVGFIAYKAVKWTTHPGSASQDGMGADEFPDLTERWAYGSGDHKVVAVDLSGFIGLAAEEDLWSEEAGSAMHALRCIRRATHDPEVKALILVVDSGGGGITASDILYNQVQKFKEAKPGRCVVALFGDIAASGAYYVAAAADYIVAHPTTLTGSIGVLIQTVNVRELANKIGVKDVTLKSGPNKDLMNPMGEMTEAQRAMLQSVVDELHSRFVSIVAEGRSLEEMDVRGIADGRVFLASQALALGLVDEIGYWDEAVSAVEELLAVDRVKIYKYEEGFSFSSLLRSGVGVRRLSLLDELRSSTRLLYEWRM